MPTNRRYRPHERRYNATHEEVLLTGRAHLASRAMGFFFGDKMIMHAVEVAWNELRDELLPRFVLEHPGTRPWAWWRFDAPEPTRQLLGGFDAFAKGAPKLLYHEILDWGTGWYVSVGANEMADPPVVETQAGYLERHGLLSDTEREALDEFPREASMCAREEVARK